MERLRASLRRVAQNRDWPMIVIGAAIGIVTAIGAVYFHAAVHWLEHVCADVQRQKLPLWLMWLLPACGAAVTGLMVHFLANAARGHGVPQVMDAVIRRRGVIPLRVGLVKTATSISTVGSGGSAGVEGPIVQIGSTVGSVVGQMLRVPVQQLPVLVGCGAAAGISSVFNAPIAGVFFVLEIILRDFSLRTFTPIVVASVFSAATTQTILGRNEAIFPAVLDGFTFSVADLPSYIVFGVVCAAISVGFTKLLHVGEHAFERLRLHPVAKPIIGATLLGVLGIAYMLLTRGSGADAGFPPMFGNGYLTIEWLIDPASFGAQAGTPPVDGLSPALWVLALLCVCKAVGTVFTLASGGSGGVFAPSLFLGAAAGAAFGVLLRELGLLGPGSTPASFALVGMAAVLAGTTFAPLTAILMLFELTREPTVLLPIMMAAIIATLVAQLLMPDSIYTAKLRQQGVNIGTGRDLTVLRRIPVTRVDLVPLPSEPVFASDPLSKLITLHAQQQVPDFVVVEQDGRYLGMVTGADMRAALIDREAIPLLLVAELMRGDMPTISPEETLDTVMDKFAKHDVASLCMIDQTSCRPLGMVSRGHVFKTYQRELQDS